MAEKELSFVIFGNVSKAFDPLQITETLDYLREHEADVYIEQNFYNSLQKELKESISIVGVFGGINFDVDHVIFLGGDSTLLRAASKVGLRQIPIIGVNMGRLGFLANVAPEEIRDVSYNIFEGRYEIEECVVIQLEAGGEAFENCSFALNDIAILKYDNTAMTSMKTSVNDELSVTYLIDGLVISTPTGSTACLLSVGSLIIAPQSGILNMTPVAPHSLNIRSIVISDGAEIKLEVRSRNHNLLAAMDRRSEKLSEGVTLAIERVSRKARIVKAYG